MAKKRFLVAVVVDKDGSTNAFVNSDLDNKPNSNAALDVFEIGADGEIHIIEAVSKPGHIVYAQQPDFTKIIMKNQNTKEEMQIARINQNDPELIKYVLDNGRKMYFGIVTCEQSEDLIVAEINNKCPRDIYGNKVFTLRPSEPSAFSK